MIILGDTNTKHMPYKRCLKEISTKLGMPLPRHNPKILELDETLCNVLNTNRVPFNADCYMRRTTLFRSTYIAGKTEAEYELLTKDYLATK